MERGDDVRSREEILERIDVLARKAEIWRRKALDPTLPQDCQIAYIDRAGMCNAGITELRWALDEKAD